MITLPPRPAARLAAALLAARRASSTTSSAPAWTAATTPPPTDAAGLAHAYGGAAALVGGDGGVASFADLSAAASTAATALRRAVPALALPATPPDPATRAPCGARVALLAPPSPAASAAAFAVWRAGGVAFPLHAGDPPPALAAALDAAGAAATIVGDGVSDGDVLAAVGAGGRAVVRVGEVVGGRVAGAAARAREADAPCSPPPPSHGALILFTSGTTGRPKPALHTHASLAAQASAIVGGWRVAPADCVLNALPPHHIHGFVVAGLAPLAGGAAVRCEPRFDADAVWRALTSASAHDLPSSSLSPPTTTILMGVPTMYARLLAAVDRMDAPAAAAAAAAAARLRFAACGSAPCPAPVAERWAELSGGRPLVERYGSTEAGIVLSAGLPAAGDPPLPRGRVGWPLPGVRSRVAGGGHVGDLELAWPGAFATYLGRPAAAAAAWTPDGWLRTGDVVSIDASRGGAVTILGRRSVDVFKVGGEQVSALAVEDALRSHTAVADAAVVSLASDGARGAAVAAAVVAREGHGGGEDDARQLGGALAAWVAARLPSACVPTRFAVVDDLPRNAMGKVDKGRVAGEAMWVKVRRAGKA